MRLKTSSLTSLSTGFLNVVEAMKSHPRLRASARSLRSRGRMSRIPKRPQWCAMRWFPGFSASGTMKSSQCDSADACSQCHSVLFSGLTHFVLSYRRRFTLGRWPKYRTMDPPPVLGTW